MAKSILFTAIALVWLVIFAGCASEERISEHLPIAMNNQFRLTDGLLDGWPELLLEKAYFNESELIYIYRTLSSFIPYEGPVVPPWGDAWPVGGSRVILHVTNERHSIQIQFILTHSFGEHARVVIDDTPEQWFTFDYYAYLELVALLPAPPSPPFHLDEPIALGRDESRIIFGGHEQRVRTNFRLPEQRIINRTINSLIPYEGTVIPPWRGDVSRWLLGLPVILQITTPMNTIEITFTPHSYWDTVFAAAQVDDTPEQWFTLDLYTYLEFVGILPR